MYNTIQIKRRLPDSILGSGAPASLSAGELAFNEVDHTLYYGASATSEHGSVIAIGGPGMFVDRTTTQRISGEKTFFDIATFEKQVNIEKSLSVTENVSANNYFINGGLVIDSNRDATFNHVTAEGNLTVTGNLSVLGDFTQIDTQVTSTSAFSITNTGTGPALTVTQTGENAIAAFYDDSDIALYIAGTTGNAGFVGIGTSTPNEKLTVVGNVSAQGDIFVDTVKITDNSGLGLAIYDNTDTQVAHVGNWYGESSFIGTSNSTNVYSGGTKLTLGSNSGGTPTNLGEALINSTQTNIAGALSAQGGVNFDSTLYVIGTSTLDNGAFYTNGSGSVSLSGNITGVEFVSTLTNFIVDGGSF
jgi:hypothetical protein